MACPGSRLSDKLRRKIEGIGRTDRKDVVGQTADGCAPLFWDQYDYKPSLPYTMTSVTRLGDFWKFLATILLTKVAQKER